jgi:hypothetical protein
VADDAPLIRPTVGNSFLFFELITYDIFYHQKSRRTSVADFFMQFNEPSKS